MKLPIKVNINNYVYKGEEKIYLLTMCEVFLFKWRIGHKIYDEWL
jgi:hypothetical protein